MNDTRKLDDSPANGDNRKCNQRDLVSAGKRILDLILHFFDVFVKTNGHKEIDQPEIPMLSWRELIEWFSNWIKDHPDMNQNVIGFVIREANEGAASIRLVQGIFDKSTNNVIEARRIMAKNVDSEVAACLGKERVAIFE